MEFGLEPKDVSVWNKILRSNSDRGDLGNNLISFHIQGYIVYYYMQRHGGIGWHIECQNINCCKSWDFGLQVNASSLALQSDFALKSSGRLVLIIQIPGPTFLRFWFGIYASKNTPKLVTRQVWELYLSSFGQKNRTTITI